MNCLRNTYSNVRNYFIKLDIFGSNVTFKHKEEEQYTTCIGACVTLALAMLMIFLFFKQLRQLISKQNVEITIKTHFQHQPKRLNLNSQRFNFAIGINNINFSDPKIPSYFKINLLQYNYNKSAINPLEIIEWPMFPCSTQNFSRYGLDLAEKSLKLQWSDKLCPGYDYILTLQGKQEQDIYKYFNIEITKDNQKGFLEFLRHNQNRARLKFYFINYNLNLYEQNGTQSYIQDKFKFDFNNKPSNFYEFKLKDYSIQTDNSSTPITDYFKQYGFYFDNQFFYQKNYNQSLYLALSFKKSLIFKQVKKNYQKFDHFIAYLGGLIGFCAVTLNWLIRGYNQKSMLISISNKTYRQQLKKPEEIMNKKILYINFFYYIGWVFYNLFLKNCIKIRKFEQYKTAFQLVQSSLNIVYLLKRFMFYDECIEILFQPFQIYLLHLVNPPQLQLLQQRNEMFNIREKLGIIRQKQMGKIIMAYVETIIDKETKKVNFEEIKLRQNYQILVNKVIESLNKPDKTDRHQEFAKKLLKIIDPQIKKEFNLKKQQHLKLKLDVGLQYNKRKNLQNMNQQSNQTHKNKKEL